MLIALIVVVLVAVALAVMLVMARNSAAENQAAAEAREAALTAQRDELTATRDRLDGELDVARSEIGQLNTDLGVVQGDLRSANVDLDQVRSEATEQAARIESQSTEIAALVVENNGLQERADAADAARAEAEAEAVAAEARNSGVSIGDLADVEGAVPATLWDLEVSRSERTWRTSVAVDPSAPQGPFETTDDPVRLAVEIEAAALRENVGAFISIDWQAPPIEDPARRHLVVRVAQEMLEAAARNPEPLRLVVDGDDAVRLRLETEEESSEPMTVPTLDLAGGLVELDDESGRSVTVKAD